MKINQQSFAVLGFCLSFTVSQAFAAGETRGYKVVECPKIPPAYQQVINNLAALKNKIKSEAQCQGVKTEMGELENLVNSERRARFLEIIRANNDKTVDPATADFLRKYAEDVSNYSLRLMTIMKGTQACFPEEERGTSLNAITTVVYEASTMLSKVAGPFGAPIAIGGNILTGILKGIQAFNASRPGYRFDQAQDRQAFTEQLCVYHSYRSELDDLLYPQVRIGQMERLRAYVTERIEALRANCTECARILETMPTELTRDTAVPAEVESLRKIADATYREKLGTETVELARTRLWSESEIARLENLRDLKLRSIGPQEVMFLKNDLDYFFFTLEAPEFLRWQKELSVRTAWRFERQVERLASTFVPRIEERSNQRLPRRASAAEILNFLVTYHQAFDKTELAHLESEMLASRDLLQLTWSSWTVVHEYCAFFTEARALTKKLATGVCDPETLKNIQTNQLPLANLEPLLSPTTWARRGTTRADPGMEGQPPFVTTPPPTVAGPKAETWTDALELSQRNWRRAANKFSRK